MTKGNALNWIIKVTVLTLVLSSLQGFGQRITPSGIIDNSGDHGLPAVQSHTDLVPEVSETESGDRIFSPTINCDANTFWMIRLNGAYIHEYNLVNSVITQTGVTYQSVSLGSLAYANENTGVTGLSPTFFSTNTSGTPYLKAFNGTQWTNMATSSEFNLPNCGGYGDHVYVDGSSGTLYHYYNGTMSVHYTPPAGRFLMVADHAVDANGNVYFFVGSSTPPYITDSLVVMSPAGNVIKQYSITFGSNNVYGSFIMGNTIYLGMGTSNMAFAGTIVPITLTQNTATLGTPIPFPFVTSNSADFESCNQGVPVGLFAGIEVSEDLSMYPNPAKDYLNIKIPQVPGIEIKEVSLISLHGQEFHPDYARLDRNHVQLQFDLIAPGLYIVKINDGKNVHYGKFEHVRD